MVDILRPKFDLGRIVATPGALEALESAKQSAHVFLRKHEMGDWGILDETDKGLNDEALEDGGRIFSAYLLASGVKIWVITEAADEEGNRSTTTCLLPTEY